MVDNKIQTLEELRASIEDIDKKRRNEHLQDNEREILEMAAVALRDTERLAIAKIQKQLIKDLQEQTARLNEQSKIIREKVSAMSKAPKVLDSIESAIKIAVKIITAVAKW